MKFSKDFLYLIIIILIGFYLRTYNINWDQGFHLHPDERAITMFSLPLQFPKTVPEFLSPQSPWNPHFFAYGNLPLYLLRISGNIMSSFDPLLGQYDKINLTGRAISTFFDLGTLILVFFLGKRLFNKTVGQLGAFFYGISVLPIQLSHFYAVDTPLTFFVLLTLYLLIKFYEHPTRKNALLVGIFFGLSLGTKTSALVLLFSMSLAIAIDFLLIFIKQPHRPHIWFPHVPIFIKRLLVNGVIITTASLLTFTIVEPYAFIDFQEFWKQNMQQAAMTRDAFTFPYTLQYVGKIPYVYELKNIFFWGLGPLLATLSFLGVLCVTLLLIRPHLRGETNGKQIIILLTFFLAYFLVVGNFAIGFMRYMLPLYPLLSLFGAVFVYRMYLSIKAASFPFYILNTIYFILFSSLFVWPLAFLHIYSKPNTRVQATQWIENTIPTGKTIAVEHWDDSLPLKGQEKYRMITLPLYDPDTPEKWEEVYEKLQQTDYLIIASNRLYTPLQKLINCPTLPPNRCYPITANYYKQLFDESLGFKKVAEFSISPSFIIHDSLFTIGDEEADESFTVYDHPKVMIFKK